ncbi:MAG TPA: hypothetical protein VFN61_12230 [Acidimicrobiales bacterium]|nr:hypothetical protein [Acidimicrobiales bacterium]
MNKFFATKSAAAAMAAAITGMATLAGSVAFAASPAWADSTTTTSTTTAPPAATTTVALPEKAEDRLAWVKKDSDRLVARRVAALNKVLADVNKLNYLGSDQAALVNEIQGGINGLQALDAKIQGDTTLKVALADRAQIFSGYRVYLLMLPVVARVTMTDWYVNFKVPAVNSQIAQIQAQENSSNQIVLGPLVSGMQSQVSIITTATNGLSAQLLAFTPAQWDANHKLLATSAADLRTAARATSVAERDYAQAERYLKTGHLSGTNHKGGRHR